VYIAPYSSSALEAAPANSVAKGTAWAGNWVEVGYTQDGVMIKPEVEHLSVMSDQVNGPVKDFITSQTATVSFVALESTLTQIKQAMGFGTVTSGSTESTLGVTATDGIPTYYTIGFEGYAPDASSSSAFYRRVIGWKALPKAETELAVKRDEEQKIAYTFELRYEPQATSSERLFKVIDREV
jgi:hypothetical protein